MAIKLIIGIGNPDLPAGRQVNEYQNTRHNVGFVLLEYIAKKESFNDFELNKKLNAEISKGKIDKAQVILAKPLTYVNKCDEVAIKLIKNYKLTIENLVVVHDDLEIPFGNTKLSFGKNSGGHKGVESVMKALKTKDFYRLRIGTGKKALDNAREQSDKKRDEFVMKFVLSKFTPSEQDELKKLFKEGYDKLLQII